MSPFPSVLLILRLLNAARTIPYRPIQKCRWFKLAIDTRRDLPIRAQDEFLWENFRYCLGVHFIGGDIREDYPDDVVVCEIEAMRDLPMTDPRWQTLLGREIFATRLEESWMRIDDLMCRINVPFSPVYDHTIRFIASHSRSPSSRCYIKVWLSLKVGLV